MVALKTTKGCGGGSVVDNRCRFCKKIFCCSECRDSHESNKHAELNSSKPKCPLCFKCDLPYDPRLNSTDDNFDRAQLVCHVVINHLPLRCKICGEKFDSNQAFQAAKPCKGPTKKPRVLVPQIAAAVAAVAASSPLIGGLPRDDGNNNTGEDLVATPSDQKLPLTPQYHIEAAASNNKSLQSSAGSLNLKHPTVAGCDNFDSPPELARHTSTPMHLSVVSLQKQHSHPPRSLPDFSLKTPSSQTTFDTIGSAASTTWGSATSASYESRYFTADLDGRLLKSSLEGSDRDRGNQNTPGWNSPFYLVPKEQDSGDDSPTTGRTNYRVERSILKSVLLSRIDDSSTHRDSIEKRVRFSDQFVPPASTNATMADSSACDNDIFFEARESLDDDDDGEQEAKENVPLVAELEPPKKVENVVDNSVAESKINASTTSTVSASSTTSRVLMMLLVEKTDDAKGFSSLDLAPLIDSGLKKLEESTASINNSKTDNANRSSATTGAIAKATKEVISYTREIDGSVTESSKGCRRRASFKDTFVATTDRIECITPPPRRRSHDEADEELANVGSHHHHHKSDGLFSAMARAVRSALKKLPAAVTARNLSREPIPPNPNSPAVAAAAVAVASPVAVDSHAAATALVHRSSIKRPRERIDSHDEVATQRDSPGSNESVGRSSSTRANSINNNNSGSSGSGSNNELVVKSPAAKRHRGWYRIRAREPIARMRERQVLPASPRGASRETQRFQQGALSIGDTFLPLPSRAHQSTQTED